MLVLHNRALIMQSFTEANMLIAKSMLSCIRRQCHSQSKQQNLQLTLAILKPDLVQHPPNLASVHNMILDNGFLVVRSKYLQLSRDRAEQFFYTRLVTYMSGGLCQPLILAHQALSGIDQSERSIVLY